MTRKKRRKFTVEQKVHAVRIFRRSGKSIQQVAEELDLSQASLSRWVSQTKIDEGSGPAGALTTDERVELARLRKENRVLQQERAFLKKAAAFFARETS